MSTVPALLDPPIGGPACEIGGRLEVVVDELVTAHRDLERIRSARERAVQLLADADGSLKRAVERVAAAEEALQTYVKGRVESPIP